MVDKIKNIMLVDDSEIDLKVNSRLLNFSTVSEHIITYTTVDSALEYLKVCQKDSNKLPEVILLDIQMPYQDGFDFLDRFSMLSLEIQNHCKIFILSSTLDFGDIKKAEANPFVVRLLKKPLDIKELKNAISLVNVYSQKKSD